MQLEFNIDDVKAFIKRQSSATRIYIGSDSERVRVDEVWYADFCTAIVVHIDGKHGCKVFGKVERERDFDQKLNRPQHRMMSECYKAAEMYLALADVLVDRDVEIHLDLNSNPEHGSNCALQQAIGYVRGTCNIVPKIKPDSPAASFCADRLKSILADQLPVTL